MSATKVPGQAPPVDPPKHPLYALATFELRGYRRQLENAIAFFDTQDPVPPARDDLRVTLNTVTTEQESRTGLSHA